MTPRHPLLTATEPVLDRAERHNGHELGQHAADLVPHANRWQEVSGCTEWRHMAAGEHRQYG